MSKKIELKPESDQQLESWKETLKRSKFEYEIIIRDGIKSISVDEAGAKLLQSGDTPPPKIGFWKTCAGAFIGLLVLSFIAGLCSDENTATSPEDIESKIAEVYQLVNSKKYNEAVQALNTIKATNASVFAGEITELRHRIDSLQANREKGELKANLNTEINSINNGVDFSTYRGSVAALQMELALFTAWYSFIEQGKLSKEAETQRLAEQLERKVKSMQVKEFPAMRKEYGDIAKKNLWENDVEVTTTGTGKRYINFSGGVFAANKNKKDFFDNISEILNMLRFNQARFRWYKGADEYTYWTIYEGKDIDPIPVD